VKSPLCDLATVSAFGATVKLPLRVWETVFSVPSLPVTDAVKLPKEGFAGMV
jgi:hypothetical protein